MAVAVCAGFAAESVNAQTTSIVSVGSGGVLPVCDPADNFCYSVEPSITPDGRYVAFASTVKNLIPGPPPPSGTQILRHDRLTCSTVRISQTATGQAGNRRSNEPSMSADGQVVVFTSNATNLVPGTTTAQDRVYVYDAASDAIRLVSQSAPGVPGNGVSGGATISSDGRWIAFYSDAPDLVPGDTNGALDVFLYDRDTQAIQRVSVDAAGAQGEGSSRSPQLSANGRFLVFDSTASNLGGLPAGTTRQVYRLDRDVDGNGTFDEVGGTQLSLVSVNAMGEPADDSGGAYFASVSNDGQRIAYVTRASNLVPNDTNGAPDVYLHDFLTGQTTRESVGPGGQQASGGSFPPVQLSDDGNFLAFHSAAHELVAGGLNGSTHVFRRELASGNNVVVSRNSDGDLADRSSEVGVLTETGDAVAFTSSGLNMEPDLGPVLGTQIYVRSFNSEPDACGILGFDLDELDLGDVYMGLTSTPSLVTLRNTGTQPLAGIDGSVSTGEFEADMSNCAGTLGAGETCQVGITFTPSQVGPAKGTLTVTADGGFLAGLALAGNGVEPDYDPLLDQKIDINDGNVFSVAGAAVVFTVDVPETGGTITGFSFTGTLFLDPAGLPGSPAQTRLTITTPDASTYVVGGNPPAGTPWDFQTATGTNNVTYRHGIGGDAWNGDGLPDFDLPDVDAAGTWQFSFVRAGGFPSTSQWRDVSIVLHSKAPSPPVIEIDPDSLTSTLIQGHVESQALTLANLGEETALAWQVTNDAGAGVPLDCALPGWVTVDPPDGVLPAGGSQTINVTFDATGMAAGIHAATLCIESNDPATPLLPVPLSLTVIASEPILEIDSDAIDFGEVAVGDVVGPATVVLTSTGTGAVHAIELETAMTPFTRSGGDCPVDPFGLLPGQSCTVAYTFSPIQVGAAEQALAIASDGGAIALTLSGIGITGEPDRLLILGGDGQTTTVGTMFAQPLAVQVRDAYNNPVSGVVVSFGVPATGPSATLSSPTGTTDNNGYVAVTAIANDIAGAYAVSAGTSFGQSVEFDLNNAAASVDVGVAIVVSREQARPGQMLDYVVTLGNTGPDVATAAAVASTLAPGLDLDVATWQCLGPTGSGCTAAGAGNLADEGLSLAAGGSVTYLLSAPVRLGADEESIETLVETAAPGDIHPGNDRARASTRMVLFSDGFQAYGDGAMSMMHIAAGDTLGAEHPVVFTWGDGVETGVRDILVGEALARIAAGDADGTHRGFRLERMDVAGLTLARLVAVAAGGGERATAWAAVEPGAELALTFVDDDDGAVRTLMLLGDGIDLRLAVTPAEPAQYRLWADATTRIVGAAD